MSTGEGIRRIGSVGAPRGLIRCPHCEAPAIIRRSESITVEELVAGRDALAANILRSGGLLGVGRLFIRQRGKNAPELKTNPAVETRLFRRTGESVNQQLFRNAKWDKARLVDNGVARRAEAEIDEGLGGAGGFAAGVKISRAGQRVGLHRRRAWESACD